MVIDRGGDPPTAFPAHLVVPRLIVMQLVLHQSALSERDGNVRYYADAVVRDGNAILHGSDGPPRCSVGFERSSDLEQKQRERGIGESFAEIVHEIVKR